jgi:hypothetical protein
MGTYSELFALLGEKDTLILDGSVSAGTVGSLDLSLTEDEVCVITDANGSSTTIAYIQIFKGDVINPQRTMLTEIKKTQGGEFQWDYNTFFWFGKEERIRLLIGNSDPSNTSTIVLCLDYVIFKRRTWDNFINDLRRAAKIDLMVG